jgi:hypothetical protein
MTYRLEPYSALIRLLQHYATPFMDANWLGAAGIALGLFLYPFLALVGSRRLLKSQPSLWPWIIYPWVYLLVFSIPNPLIFRWYLTPPLPVYFLVIFCGLEGLLTSFLRQRVVVARLVFAGFLVWALASSLSEWRLTLDHGPTRPAPEMAFIKLELLYRQAADIVSPYLDSTKTLAAGDVGVLGFYTPARILDTVGLNSAESLLYYPLDASYYVINYAIPSKLILEQNPDAVVVLEVYGRKTFLVDPVFQKRYKLLKTLPTDIYGSQGMLIFVRN